MKRLFKRAVTFALAAALISGTFYSAGRSKILEVQAQSSTTAYTGKTPKYIFLFIGDGMSYPQITSASDYLGKLKYGATKVASDNLNFMSFPVSGNP